MIVGYARTSSLSQIAGLEAQVRDLEAAGCEKIFQEQVSSVAERQQLEAALDYVREGDSFTVTKIDRLARSVGDLLAIVARLERKKVSLRVLSISGNQMLDTTTSTGRLMLAVIGAVGQAERDLRAVGWEKIFAEQVSSVAEREQLEAALDYVREGDQVRGRQARSAGTVGWQPAGDRRPAGSQEGLSSGAIDVRDACGSVVSLRTNSQ
jgi:DNA invertase Pin-like site-specific DNA recombinase